MTAGIAYHGHKIAHRREIERARDGLTAFQLQVLDAARRVGAVRSEFLASDLAPNVGRSAASGRGIGMALRVLVELGYLRALPVMNRVKRYRLAERQFLAAPLPSLPPSALRPLRPEDLRAGRAPIARSRPEALVE